ncbi:MAG: hypothetical protein H6Q98_679 [Nitrospirae bacterium]|jgi:hypothetical protein|nr:hypothetical protein [Nitrospirota bacterium]
MMGRYAHGKGSEVTEQEKDCDGKKDPGDRHKGTAAHEDGGICRNLGTRLQEDQRIFFPGSVPGTTV